jgi:DNA-binding Lrp family transcriptional regulator
MDGAHDPALRPGGQSIADLARRITMSHSATAERVRRLEQAGVITGCSARDLERVSGRIGALGADVVHSAPLPPRPLLPPAAGWAIHRRVRSQRRAEASRG